MEIAWSTEPISTKLGLLLHSEENLLHIWLKVCHQFIDLGLSENSVALHPMVNDHYPY